MPHNVRHTTRAQRDLDDIEADADKYHYDCLLPKKRKIHSAFPVALRREEGPFVPHNVRRPARAKRDFDDIKADTNVFRKRILRKPQLRQHHNLTLLRRRHVHPRCHPASTPAQRLHFNHAKRCSIHAKDIQLAANAMPSTRADITINKLGPGCFQKPDSQIFTQLPDTF